MLDHGPPESIARVRYLLAMCEVQLGRPERARPHLDEARAYFESTAAGERLVECMALEISHAILTQNPDGVDIGKRALAACRELDPAVPMLEVRILNMLASAHLTAGQWLEAIDAYEQAIKVAGPLFDMKRQARLFNEAALAYKEIGRYEAAVRHITQAVALLEVTREPVMLARAENNFGVILLAMHDPARARPHLERSLALCVQTGLEVGRSHALLSLAELCVAEGRLEPARLYAQQALEFAGRLHERDSCAQAHLWLGLIAAAAGDVATCDQEFAVAIEQLEAAGAVEWLARGHETYAEVLEKRGEIALANAELKSALGYRSRATSSVPPIA
jgi:tetratricopeptide (TPR) repeat protein